MATSTAQPAEHRRGRLDRAGRAVTGLPPASFFTVSAVFHYLGPSLAFLLFAHVSVLGVAWLRIASAAVLLVPQDLLGVGLVVVGVAVHHPAPTPSP